MYANLLHRAPSHFSSTKRYCRVKNRQFSSVTYSWRQCWGSTLISMRTWIQGAQTMRIHADSDPCQTYSHKNLNFLTWKIYLMQVMGQKTYRYFRTCKGIFDRQEPSLFMNFCNFPYSWIRIRLPHTDPDPGQPNECGSMWIRIHKTAWRCWEAWAVRPPAWAM